MNTKEANIALLSTIPDESQKQIYNYLNQNFCNGNPYKAKSTKEIYSDLAKSKSCYEQGEFEDFDDALDDISERYGL